ncbi:HD domain-containing protein [Myxococcus sp. CA051A]|uniref:HD domain-containing protein n=1 Tax=Myxococcus llanfairpwllgwyngyllgogerychwyrndrobwllllantysiliogogogochensis TaxID=2590453 RepID=A0A540WRF3_9BACT|nr:MULTISPECIES: HD domain-containing protein [Myxococcus]NTX00368.1 HD domain-containing protein [Myxococcus sp. CA040A]NTX15865.1 HD domain-containing protein [Myxococcus sp. CA056]NTX33946.1 HD domain-containing protein [Myxococcus sp. CA033]NTX65267.1 HD domain-containing protein [Myxococcus sp. CA051A]TQF11578.1 HD domain-containing protein [Myxococcus llanfairpwllgwyngyllgogerychwyrndrobwllllantysiliogogogochensis]
MRIRDPIHGTIPVSESEKAVIDSRHYQRLRYVRQLGFGDLAFPGATHTRHIHSLGAMHVASRVFGAVAARSSLPEDVRERFCTAVRLAVLCHDLGHMPLSHASERIAPKRSLLRLPGWLDSVAEGEQATHEDYTAKILLDSSLTPIIEREFGAQGITPMGAVALITGAKPPKDPGFTWDGVDWTPLLRAIVSGELDADRMDYLLRDSFYTGVNYGRYDMDWIIGNLNPAVKDGRAYLALSRAAAFAFEDFLLSRYHMFVSVYLHHTSVSFDYMLRRYYEESPGEFEIPSDPEAFLLCDDSALWYTLRRSRNKWAQRIITRQGFKLLAQYTERDAGYDLDVLRSALVSSGFEHYVVESVNVLSKYASGPASPGPSLFIIDASTGRLTEVARYTALYQRYSGAVRLTRLFVRPDQSEAAHELMGQLLGQAVQS